MKINCLNIVIEGGVEFVIQEHRNYDETDIEVLVCGEDSSPEYDTLITYAICVLHLPTMIKGNVSEQLRKLEYTNLLYINDNNFLIPGKQPGKLIVVEGPDGVGKTTQVK